MNIERRIDLWVAEHQEELLGFLSRLVQTPSEVRPPHGGELACQLVVEAAYRAAGARVDVFTPEEVTGLREHPAFFGTWDGMPRPFADRPDVVGVFPGKGGGRSILISAHVDTVTRAPMPWKDSEPFSGEIKNGRLYGRGSWDTKWGIATGLFAVKCLRDLDVPLRGDVILESVVDEEYGGGHGVLASRLRGYNADIAINCEPTNLVVCPAHRGGGQWRIMVHGDSGLGFGGKNQSNAVYKLARLIEAVKAFDIERNKNPQPPRYYEESPFLPSFTLQVGGGGDSFADLSGVPPECYLVIWFEEFPGTDQETHERQFTTFVKDFLAKDAGFDGAFPVFTPTIRFLPGSSIDDSLPIFNMLQKSYLSSGYEFRVAGAPLACDTFVFNLHSPTPALTLGPRGANAHAADEFVLVEDVLALARIFARTIYYWSQ